MPPPAAPAPVASTQEEGGDILGCKPTPVDRLLDAVFGNHIHSNDGRHLDGGVGDDLEWQSLWLRITPRRGADRQGGEALCGHAHQ